jgi:uncharacterized protein YjbJ (UPF0337 family)
MPIGTRPLSTSGVDLRPSAVEVGPAPMATELLYHSVAHGRFGRPRTGGLLMGHMDHDRPDDSNEPRHTPGSIREETSAVGQRAKGAVKEAAGAVTGNENVKDKGERENAAGIDRERKNDAV